MSATLAERARLDRRSGAVLKVRLSNLRSKYPTGIVLILEGDQDVGPVSAWLSRTRDTLSYVPLPGEGKDQLLDLRRRLQADTSDLRHNVFFIVDRDFDGLKGQSDGPDIFCTDAYSVENYLVSEDVLASLLADEFRCPANPADCEKVIEVFREALSSFMGCMRSANQRIHTARVSRIRSHDIEESITKYVVIKLREVTSTPSAEKLDQLVKLEREPTAEEIVSSESAFLLLQPAHGWRGKFFLSFFLKWLEHLAAERRSNQQKLFTDARNIKFSPQFLSLRSLAQRSRMPQGFAEFVAAL